MTLEQLEPLLDTETGERGGLMPMFSSGAALPKGAVDYASLNMTSSSSASTRNSMGLDNSSSPSAYYQLRSQAPNQASPVNNDVPMLVTDRQQQQRRAAEEWKADRESCT